MAARWSIGSYNRFIGEARSRFELSTREARELYRELRDREGHPIFASFLKTYEPEQEEREERPEAAAEELEEWLEIYDEADEFEDVELTGAFDTGKGKKK